MVSGIMLFDGDFRWAFTRSWGRVGGEGEAGMVKGMMKVKCKRQLTRRDP